MVRLAGDDQWFHHELRSLKVFSAIKVATTILPTTTMYSNYILLHLTLFYQYTSLSSDNIKRYDFSKLLPSQKNYVIIIIVKFDLVGIFIHRATFKACTFE